MAQVVVGFVFHISFRMILNVKFSLPKNQKTLKTMFTCGNFYCGRTQKCAVIPAVSYIVILHLVYQWYVNM